MVRPEADEVAEVPDEERGEAGYEEVLRQHEQHVARQREDQRRDEPGPARVRVGGRVEQARGGDQRDERRRLAHVLERAAGTRLRDPVADAEQRRDDERDGGRRVHGASRSRIQPPSRSRR